MSEKIFRKEIEDRQSGFYQIQVDTDSLSDDIEDSISEIFDRGFMIEYTRYSDIREFMKSSPTELHSLRNTQGKQFDQFVSSNTLFDDWVEMKEKALDEWFVSNAKF